MPPSTPRLRPPATRAVDRLVPVRQPTGDRRRPTAGQHDAGVPPLLERPPRPDDVGAARAHAAGPADRCAWAPSTGSRARPRGWSGPSPSSPPWSVSAPGCWPRRSPWCTTARLHDCRAGQAVTAWPAAGSAALPSPRRSSATARAAASSSTTAPTCSARTSPSVTAASGSMPGDLDAGHEVVRLIGRRSTGATATAARAGPLRCRCGRRRGQCSTDRHSPGPRGRQWPPTTVRRPRLSACAPSLVVL